MTKKSKYLYLIKSKLERPGLNYLVKVHKGKAFYSHVFYAKRFKSRPLALVHAEGEANLGPHDYQTEKVTR